VIRRRAAVVGVALALLAALASAQDGFRITHTVDRGDPAHTRINGTVFNDGRNDVADVYVTAEARDGGGKIVARGIAFVSPSIASGRSASFSATVPTMPGATSYHVRVSSFRFAQGPQSP
jgi:hypothetical protein